MSSVLADPFDDLAAPYDAAWFPPPAELFELLRSAGIAPGARVLDVGAGTGFSSAPLVHGGAAVTALDPSAAMLALLRRRMPEARTVTGRAESLPFEADAFDAAVCGDALHLADARAAMAELVRVVRPRGTIAIWWSTISTGEDVLGHRANAAADTGLGAVAEPLSGGFRAFYAAALSERTVRTVGSAIRTTVDGWVAFESARAEVRAAYGARTDAWLDALRLHLQRAYGGPKSPVVVRTLHYVYLGRV